MPEPVARGGPGHAYGLPWGAYRWLTGEDPYRSPIRHRTHVAKELEHFVAALRETDASGGPASWRGGPLAGNDTGMRNAIRDLGADGTVDPDAATAVWEEALRLPRWNGAPVWPHGDLLPGNLLTRSGRLTAVIDFGGLGVGDPAADTLAAWAVFDAGSRDTFRAAAAVDDATWARGRGWALCFGLSAHRYYRGGRDPALAGVGPRAVREVPAERAAGRVRI